MTIRHKLIKKYVKFSEKISSLDTFSTIGQEKLASRHVYHANKANTFFLWR